jgi:hypothetical protein
MWCDNNNKKLKLWFRQTDTLCTVHIVKAQFYGERYKILFIAYVLNGLDPATPPLPLHLGIYAGAIGQPR